MKTVPWDELKHRKVSPKRVAEIERAARREAVEMTLRELREFSGKTQSEVAAASEMAQSELSRLERRDDFLVSTLKRYVEALGGELEVSAVFGRRRIRLGDL
ncbi:MAG: helix-turn-helix domain-containing protein [Archangium sp.]